MSGDVEPAVADDLPELARLMTGGAWGGTYTYDTALAKLRWIRRRGDVLLCVRDDSQVPPRAIAMTWLHFGPPQLWIPPAGMAGQSFGRPAYGQLMLVSEAVRGQWVGTRLLHATETIAGARADFVYAMIVVTNVGVRRLVERHGFRLHSMQAAQGAAPEAAMYGKRLAGELWRQRQVGAAAVSALLREPVEAMVARYCETLARVTQETRS